MDLQGTDFQLLVWNALCSIPRGSTASYQSIAEQIGSPNASRAVGTACKLNPIPLFIPCHRVVKQDHSIGQFALGTNNKKYSLRDGVIMTHYETIVSQLNLSFDVEHLF